MEPSCTLRAGHLGGRALWDDRLQTFAAVLDVFEHERSFPPPTVRFGTRTAEFVTSDALANHLIGVELAPDTESLTELCCLGQAVAEAVGHAELVGLDGRRLYLRTPSGTLLGLRSRIDHDDYRHRWGDPGPATVETARLMCEVAWMRRPNPDVEAFALALTMEHLAAAEPDFSMAAATICDWFLTDAEPSTSLGPEDLAAIRRAVGLTVRPGRDPVGG